MIRLGRPRRYSSALGRGGILSGMSHDCSRRYGRNRFSGAGRAGGPGSTNVLHYPADRYPDLCGPALFRLPDALGPARAQAIHLYRDHCAADSRDCTLAVRFCIPEVSGCGFARRKLFTRLGWLRPMVYASDPSCEHPTGSIPQLWPLLPPALSGSPLSKRA